MKFIVRSLFVFGLASLTLLGLSACGKKSDKDESYRSANVDRGAIVRSVSATGGLEPVITVDVGASVSGPILSVAVDFNDRVKAGQELARIDPQSFTTRATQLRADVDSQRGSLGVQEAQLAQAQAEERSAALEMERAAKLAQSGFVSDQNLLVRQTALDRAQAGVKLAMAQINAQRARVKQSQAQLASAEVDLARSIIRSPVNGVVVDRRVDPGQSVAASLQAPILFQIAEDLSRLQANISVDEADIGDIRQGQAVRFTVDAFPGEEFPGRVSQIRLLGVQNQGVVSYVVVVEADNPRNNLLPGMTANAEIRIEEKEDVLRLPVAALRYRVNDPALVAQIEKLNSPAPGKPANNGQTGAQAQSRPAGAGGANNSGPNAGRGGGGNPAGQLAASLDLTPEQSAKLQDAFRNAFTSGGQRPGPEASDAERRAFFRRVRDQALRSIEPSLNPAQKVKLDALRKTREGQNARDAVVLVMRGDKPVPVKVRLALTDNNFAEIVSGDVKVGDAIVIGGGPKAKNQNSVGPGGPAVRIRGG